MNIQHSNNSHKNGVTLIIISAVIFSSAGIFTKGLNSGAWEIIFWRSFFAIGFTMCFIIWRGKLRQEFMQMGMSGIIIAIIAASGSGSFIFALKLTTMANVALIYATTPLLASVLAWLWIKERLTRKVAIGCCITFMGVGIIFQGSLGNLNLVGDLLSLWMAFTLAFTMVAYRRYPKTPSAGPVVLSCALLVPVGGIYGDPFSVPFSDLAFIAAFGLVFAIAGIALIEGAKRVPAGETALLSALETPLAPLLGWLVFMEIPTNQTYVGGTLIITAVLWTQFKRSQKIMVNPC